MKPRVALILLGLLGISWAICGEVHAQGPTAGTDCLGPLVEMSVREPGGPPQKSGVRFALHAPQGSTVVTRPVETSPPLTLPPAVNPASPVPSAGPAASMPSSLAAGQPDTGRQPGEATAISYQSLPPSISDPQDVAPQQPLGPAAIGPRSGSTQEMLLLEELAARVRALEGNRQDRALLDRLRQYEATQRGIDTTEEEWQHTWGGRIMGDWINWPDRSEFIGQSNYFEFRRLRLFVSGTGYGVYDYKLQLEFAPEVELEAPVIGAELSDPDVEWNSVDCEYEVADTTVSGGEVDLGGFGVELKDAFIGIHDIPYLGYVRFGHFKTPFSLSELTGSKYLTFLERPIPHIFAPGREVGVAAYHHSVSQEFTWAYGAFFDELDEMEHVIEDHNQGTRLVGRITWTPHYDELSEGRYLVHTGLGYVYTRPRGVDELSDDGQTTRFGRYVRFRSRPEIHRGDRLIDSRVNIRGNIEVDDIDDLDAQQYHMLDTELAWVHGPLSVQSELVWAGIDEVTLGRVNLYGAYVFASYFLTGEHRSYDRLDGTFGRVYPYENFWLVNTPRGCRSGWGAWEVAARWSFLDFSELEGQQLHDLTLGVNWYWNPHARLMFNWIHPFAHNSPAANPPGLVNADGNILAMRFQVDF